MASAMTLSTPEDQVEGLMKQVAEENGLEVLDKLADATPGTDTVGTLTNEEEDKLSRRQVFCSISLLCSLSVTLSIPICPFSSPLSLPLLSHRLAQLRDPA